MKYTNYIINGNIIHVEQFIPDKIIFRQIIILCLIVISIFGILFLLSLVPISLLMDWLRIMKIKYYINLKKYKRYRYYNDVLHSLNIQNDNKTFIYLFNDNHKILMNPTKTFEDIIMTTTIPYKIKIQYNLIDKYLLISEPIKNIHGLIGVSG